MQRIIHSSIVFAMIVAPACEREPGARVAETGVADSQSVANRFDPARAQPGDTVASLVLDSIDRQRTPSGEWIGSARFAGAMLVSGRTFRHPDGDDYPFPCFEVDSASAAQLPRWAGDERRPWFCFENAADAR